MWIRERQYTGRIVNVSNARYLRRSCLQLTSRVPFIWDEMILQVDFNDDKATAERILLQVAERHTAEDCRPR